MKLPSLIPQCYFYSLLFLIAQVECSKILMIVQIPMKSHYILTSTLVKALAARGHDVTYIHGFADEPRIQNVTEIDLPEIHEINKEYSDGIANQHNRSMVQNMLSSRGFTDKLVEAVLANERMQDLVDRREKFDLVIIEVVFNEAFYGYSHVFRAPVIALSTLNSYFVKFLNGNVAPYSFVPSFMTTFPAKMSFYQRLVNTVASAAFDTAINVYRFPQESLYKKYFKDAPELNDLIKRNTALFFINSHVCFESPRPYLPNMIPIGGMHITEPKRLPQDLQTFLDNSEEGVIVFSLGSYLKLERLGTEKIRHIFNTFRKLPVKVIWKFEEENMPNKPDNVLIKKWLPQSDILAHPNVILFINHGGLLSSMEAVYRGIPLIGVPFYGDQPSNIAYAVEAGNALTINFQDIDEESFSRVINEMLQNPKYRATAQKRSAIFRDQPMKPLDKAIYWIEYVIRHKGAQHLQSAAVELKLFQYLLLDIILLIVVVSSIALLVFYYVLKSLKNLFLYKDENKKNL